MGVNLDRKRIFSKEDNFYSNLWVIKNEVYRNSENDFNG